MRRELLLSISGARPDVLAQCPTERIKFQSLGWAILTTSGLATVSMWFALDSAMGVNALLALFCAVAWGFVIMGIDRWLITSMPIEGKRRFVIAIPRLVLAGLLGTIISTPIVLRIFESEINAQIAVIKQERASNFLQKQAKSQVVGQVTYWRNDVASLEKVVDSNGQSAMNPASDKEVQTLTKQLSTENTLVQQYYRQWQCQLYGGSGCPPGNGQLAQASQKSYQQASAQAATTASQIHAREQQLTSTGTASQKSRLDQANNALPAAQQQLTLATARQNALQANFDAQNGATNGLLIRLEALDQLSSGNATVNGARIVLFLLFLVIECLPVTVKLMQRPGNYEKILQAERDHELADARRAYRQRRQGPVTGNGSQDPVDATDILEIFARNEPSRETLEYTNPLTSRSAYRDAEDADLDTRDDDENLSISDRGLRDLRDDRISASSDGHGGTPFGWDNDEL